MIPRHSGDVGVHEVDFPLTRENLEAHLVGKKSYTRTGFLVARRGDECAVVQMHKEPDKNLFHTVKGIDLLAGPDRALFVSDLEVDVLNVGHMLRAQAEHPGKLVVVQGRFEHVSFVDVRLPAEIRIVDYIPPRPSKLLTFIEEIIGRDSRFLKIETRYVDLIELSEKSKGDPIILPCKASYDSGIKGQLFLDQAPALSEVALDAHALIGCSLSARIFEELYGRKPNLTNICARESDETRSNPKKTISRCCKVKEGLEVDENLVLVPWGANVCEVAEALRVALSM